MHELLKLQEIWGLYLYKGKSYALFIFHHQTEYYIHVCLSYINLAFVDPSATRDGQVMNLSEVTSEVFLFLSSDLSIKPTCKALYKSDTNSFDAFEGNKFHSSTYFVIGKLQYSKERKYSS